MKKLIGKTVSVGKKINHIDIKWYTFKNGQVVPTDFEHDIIAKGGKLEEEEKKPVKVNLDLNGDGVVDKKDASIAGKVMAEIKKKKRRNSKKKVD